MKAEHEPWACGRCGKPPYLVGPDNKYYCPGCDVIITFDEVPAKAGGKRGRGR